MSKKSFNVSSTLRSLTENVRTGPNVGDIKKEINIDDIVSSQNQPRKRFTNLEELADSIQKKGLIEPLIVRRKDSKYELIAGERRLKAIKKYTQIRHVPCIIKDYTDDEVFEISLIENLQREDLNSIEETQSIMDLLDLKIKQQYKNQDAIKALNAMHNYKYGKITDNVICKDIVENIFSMLGMKWESFYRNRLPLLAMPEEIKDALINHKEFTPAHAREIAKVGDIEQRKELIEEVVKDSLASRSLKDKVKEFTKKSARSEPKRQTITFDDFPNLTIIPKKKKIDFSIDITKGNFARTLRHLADLAEQGKLIEWIGGQK